MNDYVVAFFIIVFSIFCFVRLFFVMESYATIMDSVAAYYLNGAVLKAQRTITLEEEIKMMKSTGVFFFEFWNWDMWTIIAKPNREEIKSFCLSRY